MTLKEKLSNKKLLLASGSPRRHQLLKGLDVDFEVVKQDVDETWPEELVEGSIAEYLALKKSQAYGDIKKDEVLITADTIVWHNNAIMNKPVDAADSKKMLQKLSGSTHEVFTGVCIRSSEKALSFFDRTIVEFRAIEDHEIEYYINNYQPFDKAGSYGAQDWLGYIGMEKIIGCYYNVMGFPLRKIYESLMKSF